MKDIEPKSRLVEQAVLEMRQIVEVALENFGDLHGDEWRRVIAERVHEWRGKLSTDPQKVHLDVSPKTMLNKCWEFSEELGIVLWEKGTSSDIATNKRGYPHTFLMTEHRGHTLVIDPTIAQVVEDHNHVFVGTESQLQRVAATSGWWGYIPWISPARSPVGKYFGLNRKRQARSIQ